MQPNKYWLLWANDILKALNLKPTANRVQFLYAWMAAENTKAKNNPLATTWDMENLPASQENFNYNGGYPVKNYSTRAIGLAATVRTLKGGYYPEILRFLNNNLSLGNATPALISNLNIWGTHSLPITIWKSWPQSFRNSLKIGAGGALLFVAVGLFIFRDKIFK